MKYRSPVHPACHRECYTRDGVTLEIVVRQESRHAFELTVVNPSGVMSTWHRFFRSPEQAVAAARRAIDEEGVAAFTDVPCFNDIAKLLQRP